MRVIATRVSLVCNRPPIDDSGIDRFGHFAGLTASPQFGLGHHFGRYFERLASGEMVNGLALFR
jgi:hypothetical protein